MTEERRKQAYAEMERRMAMSHPEVEVPVKQAHDRSAMQARMEQVYQEKEVPQPVREIPKSIPVVEQPKPVVELPKLPVLPVTVEAPVVPPVVEQTVAYFPPVKHDPPAVKPVLPIEKVHEPYLQPTAKKPVNWLLWGFGLAILIVIVEVIYFLVS